jgi:AraC-like DNA-binding protein
MGPDAPQPRGDRANATATTRVFWPLLDYARSAGHDLDELLSPIGLTEAEVRDPERRLPRPVGTATLILVMDRLRDPALGLRAAEFVTPGTFDVLECAVRASRTVEDAMRVLDRFARLLDDTIRCPLEVRGDMAFWHFDFAGAPEVHAMMVEYLLASVRRVTLRVFGPLPLEQIWCRHRKPPHASEYPALLGAPGLFEAPCDAVVFRRELLAMPLPSSDPVLAGVLDRHAAELLARLPATDSFLSNARHAVRQEFQAGDPTMARVARRLGMTLSTLRRRLLDAGTTFRSLRDELRLELAQIYLRDRSLSIQEVAFLLAFRDVSAFYKSFRRSLGTTPAEFRERCR